MKTKRNFLTLLCVLLVIGICGAVLWGQNNRSLRSQEAFDDGIEQVDLNTIYLGGSRVRVEFSDVIVSAQEETRKLIVSTQEATVSTELEARLIQALDFDFMKKTQKVSYTGNGYFVVDLDSLSKDDIIDDKEKKTLTIRISHAYLQAIEIDPNKIIIDNVKESLLARGDIELTVRDYNSIEKELRTRLEEKFDTVENGQKADDLALEMVKDVYEPVIHAIDSDYDIYVEFK